jgi:hypothetical protein
MKEPKWRENLILICEKCGHKINPPANPTAELKDWLKKKLVSSGHWGPTRVVTTSCLDICPEKQIAIAWISDRVDRKVEIETIDPKSLDREALLKKIVHRSP